MVETAVPLVDYVQVGAMYVNGIHFHWCALDLMWVPGQLHAVMVMTVLVFHPQSFFEMVVLVVPCKPAVGTLMV